MSTAAPTIIQQRPTQAATIASTTENLFNVVRGARSGLRVLLMLR